MTTTTLRPPRPRRLMALFGATLFGLTAPLYAQLPVTDGLALWLAADASVATDGGGFVTDWADQSPNLNDAAQHTEGLAPLLVNNAVNGHPALRFDGVDDYLEIANSPALQPGSGDWTVFLIARRLGAGQGDFPQVIGSRPWTAGADKGWSVSLDGSGLVCSHYADGTGGHDVPAVRSATPLGSSFQMWQVEENRAAGTTAFYANGDLNRVLATAMPTAPIDQGDPIRIGREIGGANNRRANIELAEVVIYNRVLSRSERDSVAAHLSTKYNLGFTPNQAPTVALSQPADGASVAAGANLFLAATAADPDGSVRQVEFRVNGQRVALASQPPFQATVRVQTPGTIAITAVATDNRGEATTSTAVAVTVTGDGSGSLAVTEDLRLWLDADSGVAVGDGGVVTDWADRSPNLNDAAQHDTGLAPLLVGDAINGKPALRFDGQDDYLEIPNAASLQPLSGDWTVFFVGQRRAGSQGDFPQIIGSRPWTAGLDKGWSVSMSSAGVVGSHYADGAAGHDVPAVLAAGAFSTTAFQVWQVEENRGAGTTRFWTGGGPNGSSTTPMPTAAIDQADPIRIGREVGGANNRRASMDLAEVLIYGRALNATERESVTAYLSSKYGLPFITTVNNPPSVAITAPAGGSVFVVPTNITLVASATDADGSIASVQFFRGNTPIGTVTTPPFQLAVSNGLPGTVTYRAQATDNLGAVAASASVTITNITLNPPVAAPVDTTGGLFAVVDYEDSFTVGTPARPDGLYNNNGNGGYILETAHGNPTSTWTPFSNFSFNTGAGSTCCGYPGNTGNDGAATGLAQSGGGDFSIAYGVRSSYIVSVDTVLPPDRLDISSMPAPGASLFSVGSLTVFLRKDHVGGAPGIGLFNGTAEADTGATTGVSDNAWHNYAVHFDQPNNRLGIYVDGILRTNLDLTTFASGVYASYANAAVGVGGTFVYWVDNFKVGAPNRRLRSIDASDTFTVGVPGRPDSLYNNNSGGGYNVESDRSRTWLPFSNFSFNTGAGSTCCGYPGNTGNPGAGTGLAQSGGGDFSFEYGMRQSYVVEVDAVLPPDRLDISSMPAPGAGLFSPNSLTVFFRKDHEGGAPGIGLFNGAAEADTGADTGVTDSQWHRYSVHFDRPNNRLGIYVDGIQKANLDLVTFAGGAYRNYSNAAVGLGGTFVFWADNFQVGPPEVPLTISPVAITRVPGGVQIQWTGPGVLQTATDPAGPWSDLSAVRSPAVIIPPIGDNQFFRLKN